MKTINKIFTLLFVFTAFVSCKEDFLEETDFGIVAPSNVSANFVITQDNTGLVTITPEAEGALHYDITSFGDGSDAVEGIKPGTSVQHTFAEGSYDIQITATGLSNLKTRLAILYPNTHTMETTTEKGAFIAQLNLQLN